MKNIPLFLMGCGGVGRQLLQHIVSCRSLHAKQGVYLRVMGVCDSSSLVLASDSFTMDLDDSFLLKLCEVKLAGGSLLAFCGSDRHEVHGHSELARTEIDVASRLAKSAGLVVVDCSASSETVGLLIQMVDLGCCIILANKKPLTSSMEDYKKLVLHPRRIRYESTVGAGLPVLASMNRILSSGDPIHRIIGSLSGTLGYVMGEVDNGKPFSQIVRAAKRLGYTEPDPRDDLGGMDVARKALILGRFLGQQIQLDDIKIESLYPKEMGPALMSAEEFLDDGLPLLDEVIEERITKASSNGNVLRYVCVIEGLRCEVGIQEVPKNSPLGRLKGSDNLVSSLSLSSYG